MRYIFLLLFTTLSYAQQTDQVDFLNIRASIAPNMESKSVKGTFHTAFKILKTTDSIYLNAVHMTLSEDLNNKGVKTRATADKIWMTRDGGFTVGQIYQADFKYQATPKQALYFVEDQIWTQGQGKYTSHWLPSIDDMNDKIEFDLAFSVPLGQTVISNGKVIEDDNLRDSLAVHFEMKKPMSSYLVAFAMGEFKKKELKSDSGLPIELYYRTSDSSKVEATYRYSKDIFDFLEAKIAVPYPWQNYKQVPVRDFLYAGMENTGCTLFSEAFLVDDIGFNDKDYVNVNAHELAHQWFGNLVTETDSKHHWLHEGFATYYALQAERAIFGEDYYYWKLYQSAEQLMALSNEGKGQSLLNPKASSLTFYQKGAWALHILNETIGDEAFDTAIKSYLEKHSFRNVTTVDFLNEIKAASTIDISAWEKDWLLQTAFQSNAVYESLLKSSFITQLLDIMKLRGLPILEKKNELNRVLTFPNDFIGQEAIIQLQNEPWDAVAFLYRKGMASNNLFVRQAIASQLDRIPDSFKADYETLLADDSYATKEAALIHLATNFPESTPKYLTKIKDVTGFQNKNIRQLYLAFSLATGSNEKQEREGLKQELFDYASSRHSFEIREIAFGYINQLGLWNEQAVLHLINACTHHYWRFRNGARELLDAQLEVSSFRNILLTIYPKLSQTDKDYLTRISFIISEEKK